jgi:hypothetical protein
MPRLLSLSPNATQPALWGPSLVALGLAVLILAPWWPAAPVVSAMALLTLGATGATLARFGGSPSLRPILVVHIVTYAGLYVLFIGATLHAATKQGGGIGWQQAIDLSASLLPMIVAMRLSLRAVGLPSGAN